MAKAQLKVHTENILPIIKKWLYSEKEIFLRELVSNACDALHKCRILREEEGIAISDEELKIEIRIDKEKKQLIISDSGIGMTDEEVEKYIAQVAFSGAEEFLDKYKTQKEGESIIGHFGLGFYSAYMVAKKVSLETLSYKGGNAVSWSCEGGTEYEIDAGSRATRGTDIILDIDSENEEYLEDGKIRSILQQYCAFLPFPIHLNGELINGKDPLWLKAPSACTEEEYLQFYRSLYPMDADPLFWIHLNIDYPFNLKGILYFPKVHRKYDWSQSNIKLFCNRVFVSDNCKDLLPDYLMALKGAIDSPDIPLNVSRSYLQMDKTVRQLATHIAKKVADKLSSLYISDKETFVKYWPDVELIVKLGILQDEKFYEKAKDFLIWRNLKDEWTTIEEYIERNKEKNKVFYTIDDKQSSHFLDLYKEKNIEVIYTSSPIDTTVLSHLERKKAPLEIQRIDGEIDASILDTSREKTALDENGKTEATKLSELIASKLSKAQVQVEAKSLASDSLHGFLLVDEDTRRMKEYLAISQQTMPFPLPDKKTFVVNTNNSLITALPKINDQDPELASDLIAQLYELTLLSQRELEPSQIADFITRSHRVLEKFAVGK
ncbi:MAG: molecular chaperone HtpG [Rhabdochlamydiaceae bacterium]|nr:molecular chaperone HtpG [Rhabdochlamydiaceae bacterium]